MCPSDILLTQNLSTGAYNGKYHPYTGGIVDEAHILQGHLNRLGFNSGVEDGKLGPKSDAAIKRMQASFGLQKIDGKVGPNTREKLNNSCAAESMDWFTFDEQSVNENLPEINIEDTFNIDFIEMMVDFQIEIEALALQQMSKEDLDVYVSDARDTLKKLDKFEDEIKEYLEDEDYDALNALMAEEFGDNTVDIVDAFSEVDSGLEAEDVFETVFDFVDNGYNLLKDYANGRIDIDGYKEGARKAMQPIVDAISESTLEGLTYVLEENDIRAKNAAIKAAASQSRSEMELNNIDTGSYNNGRRSRDCHEESIEKSIDGITDQGIDEDDIECVTPRDGSSYTFATPLLELGDSEDELFCVDSTGFAGTIDHVEEEGVSCL